jgi:aminopeptidase N
MAHMWFGDLVTMRWWDDLWLNESFATFASVLCHAAETEYEQAWTTFANVEKSWAYRQDQLPSTHPIAADIPDLQGRRGNFDGITYAKGPPVLKQLVALRRAGAVPGRVARLLPGARWGNATFDDLLGALEESSGRDLSGWGAQLAAHHRAQPAAPVVRPGRRRGVHPFEVVQGGARPGAGELRTHRIAVGVYDDDGTASCPHPPGRGRRRPASAPRCPSWSGVAAAAGAGQRRRPHLLRAAAGPGLADHPVDRIGDIAEPLPRTLCWSAAWEMTREAELKARDFAALVAAASAPSPRSAWCSGCCMQAQTGDRLLRRRAVGRRAGLAVLVQALLFRLDTAPAGSDAQLARVNALTAACSTARCWRDARLAGRRSTCPTGWTVDTDLRWRLLHALVAHGRRATPRSTPSWRATPPRPAAPGRAGPRADPDRPRPRSGPGRARARRRHPERGPGGDHQRFAHPAQRGLLGGYVERYFGRGVEVWSRRHQRAGAGRGGGAVPVVGGGQVARWRRPTPGWPTSRTRRRCAGWCPKAGPGSCGRWARGTSTGADRRAALDPGRVRRPSHPMRSFDRAVLTPTRIGPTLHATAVRPGREPG